MKKLYFTSVYLLLVIHVFAQNQKPSLVEVRGNASMQVPPDLACDHYFLQLIGYGFQQSR